MKKVSAKPECFMQQQIKYLSKTSEQKKKNQELLKQKR